MNLKWIGAIMIIAGCGGVGFNMALHHKKEESALRQIIRVMDMFCNELEYRLTPLPELFQLAAKVANGPVSRAFSVTASELEKQNEPNAAGCMSSALKQINDLPGKAAFALTDISRSLGEYDLSGQLQGIRAARESCQRQLNELESNRTQRLRSYQTLGLCAGAALAILFL